MAGRLTVALPGPLKILIAIAAPDEGKTTSTVLDSERELARILVRCPSTGHRPGAGGGRAGRVTAALRADAYHVLHLSDHDRVTGTPPSGSFRVISIMVVFVQVILLLMFVGCMT
ncbi:MAG TPA: hypothetical protein VGJ14_04705 [Sporichthyaceae bacterium]|jgi:hypothetical protein